MENSGLHWSDAVASAIDEILMLTLKNNCLHSLASSHNIDRAKPANLNKLNWRTRAIRLCQLEESIIWMPVARNDKETAQLSLCLIHSLFPSSCKWSLVKIKRAALTSVLETS